MRTFASAIVRFFLTGTATLLPFVVTIFVVSWVVRFADAYIGPSSSFGLFLLTIVGDNHKYPGYIAGYLVVVLLIILLGFLVNRATVARVHRAIDSLFAKIPLIGKIYSGVGQVVDVFGKKEQVGRFGGVGHIRIGNVQMLGLLTSTQRYTLCDGRQHLLVFVPNSPIPATGFNVLVLEEDFMQLDMTVEDLAKLLMSLGLIGTQVLAGSCVPLEIGKTANERKTEQ
ncbi:MAG: DUF502 domain-containing protein [Desulfomonilaceae bacterium]